MNKRETNKMNSFGISEEVLLRNKPIWETDEVIKNLFGEIQLKLPLVLEYGVKQKKNGTVATVVKQTGKTSLIAHALKISVSAVSFSASQKDLVLEKEVKLIKSDLERLTQIGLYNTLSLFYKKVLPLKNSLKHLEANDIDKLKKLLDDFKTSIPQTGADKDQSQTATYNMATLSTKLTICLLSSTSILLHTNIRSPISSEIIRTPGKLSTSKANRLQNLKPK